MSSFQGEDQDFRINEQKEWSVVGNVIELSCKIKGEKTPDRFDY